MAHLIIVMVVGAPPGPASDWGLTLNEEFDTLNASLWTKGM